MSICQNCKRLEKQIEELKSRHPIEVIGYKGAIKAAFEPEAETAVLWICCGCNNWSNHGYDECEDCKKELCYNCTIDGPSEYDYRDGGCGKK
jgi:hypothetical protein